MGRATRILGIGLTLVLVIAACSGDDGSDTTTSQAPETTAAATTETVPRSTGSNDNDGDDGSTATTTTDAGSTTTAAFAVPAFTIVSRVPGAEGDTVVVLLDTDSYEALTDIDLQNVLADVVEEFPPVYEAHVVDSPDVVEFVTASDLDAESQQLLNVHYLVRLEEGFRIRYLGSFEANGVSILGS